MGLLRLLLALAVVQSHSASIPFLNVMGSQIAVQCFYIISGFYMAMILHEKYTGAGSYPLFITNRFLRIFPVYWAVLVPALLVYSMKAVPAGPEPDAAAKALLFFSQAGLFLQDAVMFFGLDSGGALTFEPQLATASFPLHRFLAVPQAWTIGVELLFYLVAPFLVRRPAGVLAVLIGLGMGLQIALAAGGLGHDPWTYRFFPAVLAYFLMGALAYRAKPFAARISRAPAAGWLLLGGTVVVILFFESVRFPFRNSVFYLAFAALLPFVFIRTANVKFDRMIGEWSYPVYIVHILIFDVLYMATGERVSALMLMTFSLAAAYLLNRFVAEPVEKIRQRRALQAGGTTSKATGSVA